MRTDPAGSLNAVDIDAICDALKECGIKRYKLGVDISLNEHAGSAASEFWQPQWWGFFDDPKRPWREQPKARLTPGSSGCPSSTASTDNDGYWFQRRHPPLHSQNRLRQEESDERSRRDEMSTKKSDANGRSSLRSCRRWIPNANLCELSCTGARPTASHLKLAVAAH